MSHVTVGDIERAIAARFPVERAEAWDRVGLLVGDRAETVTGVVLALDPTRDVIAHAVRLGANVVATHHPAFLDPPSCITPGQGSSGVVFAAASAGVALVNAHTNLDRDPEGQRLLPRALGLTPAEPLERAGMPMALVAVYGPAEHAERIVGEMAAAGAGRIGDYEGCSFSSEGTGSFTPSSASKPFVGAPSQPTSTAEQRTEMVCPRSRVRAVVAAAVAAHPYEEPLVAATDVMIARNAAALGMLCEPTSGLTLQALAERAHGAFGAPARVWGDPHAQAGTIVTTTGSAGSLVRDVGAAGGTTLVCGEVRYHDALDASGEGLAIVELGHDVSEWPLVSLLEQVVRDLPGVDHATIHPLPAQQAWWTASPTGA